jgi:hypothetical protein
MNLVSTYTTSQYKSHRIGGTRDVQKHVNEAEIYAPLNSNDWYTIIVWGVCEDGSEIELSRIIVKR